MSSITYVKPILDWQDLERRDFKKAIALEHMARHLIVDKFSIAHELGSPIKLITPRCFHSCYCILYHEESLATVVLGAPDDKSIDMVQYSYNAKEDEWIATKEEYQHEAISIDQLIQQVV